MQIGLDFYIAPIYMSSTLTILLIRQSIFNIVQIGSDTYLDTLYMYWPIWDFNGTEQVFNMQYYAIDTAHRFLSLFVFT